MPDHSKPIIAAFDFDHTLTIKDSLVSFLIYKNGIIQTYSQLATLIPDFVRFILQFLTRQEIKEKILEQFFKDMPIDAIQKLGKHFADMQLDTIIRPAAIERVRWHQNQGHHCAIVSASPDFYLNPWGQRHGFQTVLASQLEKTENGLLTGHLKGKNCWGIEKVHRLIEKFGPKSNYQLYAYGDSRGDLELLEIADYPFYRRFK